MKMRMCALLIVLSILMSMPGCVSGNETSGEITNPAASTSPTTRGIEYAFQMLIMEPNFMQYGFENHMKETEYIFTAKVTDVSFAVREGMYTGEPFMITAFTLQVQDQYQGTLPEVVYAGVRCGYPKEEYLEQQVEFCLQHNCLSKTWAADTYDIYYIEYWNHIRFPEIGETYLFTVYTNEYGDLEFTWPYASVYNISGEYYNAILDYLAAEESTDQE